MARVPTKRRRPISRCNSAETFGGSGEPSGVWSVARRSAALRGVGCPSFALQITQNLLAEMLGVHRPTVTKAARELERAGLIARGRQQVTILNRQGLVAESCECYQLVRRASLLTFPKHTRKKNGAAPVW